MTNILTRINPTLRGLKDNEGQQFNMALSYHLLFKILLVGDADVGKCAIFHPPAGDASGLSAMGVNFLKRQLEIGE